MEGDGSGDKGMNCNGLAIDIISAAEDASRNTPDTAVSLQVYPSATRLGDNGMSAMGVGDAALFVVAWGNIDHNG
jgi:hypothetical protein